MELLGTFASLAMGLAAQKAPGESILHAIQACQDEIENRVRGERWVNLLLLLPFFSLHPHPHPLLLHLPFSPFTASLVRRAILQPRSATTSTISTSRFYSDSQYSYLVLLLPILLINHLLFLSPHLQNPLLLPQPKPPPS